MTKFICIPDVHVKEISADGQQRHQQQQAPAIAVTQQQIGYHQQWKRQKSRETSNSRDASNGRNASKGRENSNSWDASNSRDKSDSKNASKRREIAASAGTLEIAGMLAS